MRLLCTGIEADRVFLLCVPAVIGRTRVGVFCDGTCEFLDVDWEGTRHTGDLPRLVLLLEASAERHS